AMTPETEPPGGGNRRRIMAYVPDQNVVLMENFYTAKQSSHEQQIWTYRYAEAKEPRLTPPAPIKVSTTADSATVSWSPSNADGKYTIYRGEGPKPWLVDYQHVGTVQPPGATFHDKGLKHGTVYYYYVQV